jgi:hypothetical protein
MSRQVESVESSIRVLLNTLPAAAKARILQEECAVSAPVENRIVRRVEAARILGRSTRAVDYLVQAGSLPRVTFPGHQRGAGFRLSDIQSLISGKVSL